MKNLLLKNMSLMLLTLTVVFSGCGSKSTGQPDSNTNTDTGTDTALTLAPSVVLSQDPIITGQVVQVIPPQMTGNGPFEVVYNFGGDSTATQLTSFTYPASEQDEQYEIFVTVTDANNQTTTITLGLITIPAVVFDPNNSAPIAKINLPLSINALSVTVNGSESSDEQNTTLNYQWNFGDQSQLKYSESATHTYAADGTYIIELTVSDTQYSSVDYVVVEVESNNLSAFELSNAAVPLLKMAPCSACHYAGSALIAGKSELYFGQDANYTAASIKAGLETYLGSDQSLFDKAYVHPITPSDHAGLNFATQQEAEQWQALLSSIWNELNPAPVNNIPVANIELLLQQNLQLSFSGATSFDLDNDPLSYVWDFNGESTDFGVEASYEFLTAGTKVITLLVSDNNGGVVSNRMIVNVIGANLAPTANFIVNPNLLTVQFDASMSQDPENDDLTYLWDFGDNQTSILAKPTNVYATVGTYPVTLTITDAYNQPVSITHNIVVELVLNPAPVPVITIISNSNDVLTVSALNSIDDGSIESYLWDFNGEATANGSLASFTFNTSGQKTITLTVIDEKGASAYISTMVGIENKAPIAAITVLTKTFLDVMFSSMDSIDPEGDNLIFAWSFGDGDSSFETNPTHSYSEADTYTVTLIVTDQAGIATTTETSITVAEQTVANQKPVAIISKTDLGDGSFQFSAGSSNDPEGSVITYFWDFGNGQTSELENTNISFALNDIYSVKLTVSDGELESNATTVINTIPVIAGDPVEGEHLYLQMCSKCHDSDDTSKPNMGMGQQEITSNALSPININQYLYNFADPDLFTKIVDTMPALGAAETCVGQCAADIAAFMLQWQEVNIVVACNKQESEMKFGPRQMRLLTVREYVNTVNDLFGFQVDIANLVGNSKIEGFSNQVDSSVDLARLDGFRAVANDIIEYSAAQDFGNIRSITACANDCLDPFIKDVAKQLYRRPLTTSEVDRYKLMFDSPSSMLDTMNNKEGMKLALKAALTSVNFLFRSEVGQTKAQLQQFYDELPEAYQAVGNIRTESPPDLGRYGTKGGNATGEYQDNVKWGLIHEFTGLDLIRIRVKSTTPTLYLYLGASKNNLNESSHDFIRYKTDQDGFDNPPGEYKTLSFLVEGITGEHAFVVGSDYDGKHGFVYVDFIEFSQGKVLPKPTVPNIPDGAFGLSTYEMASFLAYTYTGSTPDELLIAAADEGLVEDAVIKTQIERLLAKDESKQHFGYFIEEWVDVDPILIDNKDAVLFPDFTNTIRTAMVEELRNNFLDVLFDDSVPFSYLYQAGSTFVNEELAQFYGISGVTGDNFRKVSSSDRGGILLTGAFLAGHSNADESSIIIRGNQFRERLLCQHLPPFPSNVDLNALRLQQESIVNEVKDRENGLIRGAHLEYINTDLDACGGCHYRIINPLGVGLEDYDAVGRFRDTYANGLDVNFAGHDQGNREYHDSALYGYESIQTSNLMERLEFQGGVALANIMSTLPKAQNCALEKSFRYMMGTGPDEYNHQDPETNELTAQEKMDNTCVMDDMASAMSESNMNLKAAFIKFGLSDIVRFRKEGNRQ
ncbi:MAG: PKD domain-containing protein [Saccharospirillaceae bacterium]|nr:PKD domain-containing protein [Pseudomonadales bacterium]NRB77115.1 PKD domain-containing protein [Saccharospirillaceae bacterium]